VSRTRSACRGNRLRSVEVLGWLVPVFGAECEDVASGVIADAHEHIAQVVEGIDAVQFAGGDERVEDAGPLGSFVAARKEPILTAHRDPAQLPLGGIVVELQACVVEERACTCRAGDPGAKLLERDSSIVEAETCSVASRAGRAG
jgi:hypothetical protein